ncbi:MAG: tetratricopeptide repeat protein [Anaerolineae bacterium]|nr:MAG: tetratricopeptide repeat protein [Anaerolineae bacterium]
MGSLYQQAERNTEALNALQTALAHDNQDPVTYQALAAVYNALGDEPAAAQASRQAVSLYQAALSAAPGDAYTTQLALGDAYVGAGQYDQAIVAYQAAAALQPTAAAPQRGLGNAYYWQGHLDQATAAYQHAATLAPDPNAPLLTGLVQAQQGKVDDAIVSQQTAARLASQTRRRTCCWAGCTSSRMTTPRPRRLTARRWTSTQTTPMPGTC